MIGFFRINDPYRLLILFLAIVLIRLPYLISAEPLFYELNWMLIGETMNQGNVLYKDIVQTISPLSAWVYAGIDFIFGRSILIYQILATLLIGYQFVLFNNIMLRNKAYNENSYVPAFVYALLMHSFYDFFTLSPVLISMTFILLVLDNIYLRIENKLNDNTILKTGIFMGLAVLFYLPSIIFFVATIFSFLLLTGLIFRRYLLFLYGMLLPIAAVSLYYLWHNALLDMFYQWVLASFIINRPNVLDLSSLLLIIGIPGIVFMLALVRTFSASRFTNYQVRVQQVMFLMFVSAWAVWLFSDVKAPFQLIVFIPFIAFFIAHLLLQFKSRFVANIFTYFVTISILLITYALFYQNFYFHQWGNFNDLLVNQSIYEPWIADKKVLVVGDRKQIYKSSKEVATQFYSWELSQKIWKEVDKPENIIRIYEDINKHQPETIIDLTGLVGSAFKKLPLIEDKYAKVSAQVYVLKP